MKHREYNGGPEGLSEEFEKISVSIKKDALYGLHRVSTIICVGKKYQL